MAQHRDEVVLAPHERQVLADMWSYLAAEDPRLARRLHGRGSFRRGWFCVAVVLVVVGVFLIIASPATSLVFKSIGVTSYSAGVVAVVHLCGGTTRRTR